MIQSLNFPLSGACIRPYGTDALLLRGGEAVLQGPLSEVMTPQALQEVYGMDVYAWMREMYGQWVEKE